MQILVACEFSGRVREAFAKLGFFAVSCDLQPTELPCSHNSLHYQGNVLDLLYAHPWTALIAFPPCTYLCSSGARWWIGRQQEQEDALKFVTRLYFSPIRHVMIENPIGKLNTYLRKPNQKIQPWQFGEPYSKSTCFWTKNLPLLIPTEISNRRTPASHHTGQTTTRNNDRSRTYQGIANAIAEQYGNFLKNIYT